jgi:hypothetical protein
MLVNLNTDDDGPVVVVVDKLTTSSFATLSSLLETLSSRQLAIVDASVPFFVNREQGLEADC